MDIYKVLEDYNIYNRQITVITKVNVLQDDERIPVSWLKIIEATSIIQKKQIVIDMWKDVMSNELSLTIDYLSKHLEDVFVFKSDEHYYLLYVISGNASELLYYVGGNPKDTVDIKDKFPVDIARFYKELHNGFYDYCYKSMGIVEADDAEKLLSKIDEDRAELNDVICIFSNGMGDYVAYDQKEQKAILWLTSDEPDFDICFWDVVDEWTCLGMKT